MFQKNNLRSTPKTTNIHHNSRNIAAILHTLNIVYSIKTMNIGIQQKIIHYNIQYTQGLVSFTLRNRYTKLLVGEKKSTVRSSIK